MALSDELLSNGPKLSRLREKLEEVISTSRARAGFLVDEEGSPFATVGNVEFHLPHPLAGILEQEGADPILEALLGQPPSRETSCYVVERLTERCLVVLVLDSPPSSPEREWLRARASELMPYL
jgi:hypothetical protein